MRRWAAGVAAAALAASGGAMAQDHHFNGGGRGSSPSAGLAHGAQHTGPVPYVPQGRNDVPHFDGGGSAPQAGDRHLGHDNFGVAGFRSGGPDRPRYGAQTFPREIAPNHRFNWAGGRTWTPQPGYYHHHWGYGDFLPDGWFAPPFWIDDYADYDLPVPPYGYEWVRVGHDALLVDTYTGEVVEVVRHLYY